MIFCAGQMSHNNYAHGRRLGKKCVHVCKWHTALLGVLQLAYYPLTGVKLVTIPWQLILYQTSKENISACIHSLALLPTYSAYWALLALLKFASGGHQRRLGKKCVHVCKWHTALLGVPQLACCPLTGVKLVTIPPQPILYQTSKENISACSHTLALQHTYGAFEVSIRWAIQQSHHPTSMHSNNSGSFLHSLQLDKRLKLVHH